LRWKTLQMLGAARRVRIRVRVIRIVELEAGQTTLVQRTTHKPISEAPSYRGTYQCGVLHASRIPLPCDSKAGSRSS
jgi:hypothetical protein